MGAKVETKISKIQVTVADIMNLVTCANFMDTDHDSYKCETGKLAYQSLAVVLGK